MRCLLSILDVEGDGGWCRDGRHGTGSREEYRDEGSGGYEMVMWSMSRSDLIAGCSLLSCIRSSGKICVRIGNNLHEETALPPIETRTSLEDVP